MYPAPRTVTRIGRGDNTGARFARLLGPKYVPGALRNLVFRFDDTRAFAHALRAGDQELAVPAGESVADGEWVLAIFEVGTSRRATASAARGLNGGPGVEHVLAFERRDWERLVDFAEAGSVAMRASEPVIPPEPITQPSLPDPPSVPPPAASRPSFNHWRKSDPFSQGPNARVLLVDDDEDIREVVGAMLDAVGLTVEALASAEEALERVRATPFDLLVLDWNLPGMTGIELCRLIRRDATLSTLPVLFLTAHASSRDVVEAFASGADDYVVKPFRAPELGARIFGLLRRSRMGQASP
jgi:two-component system phosphate regulon response regulator PhoB